MDTERLIEVLKQRTGSGRNFPAGTEPRGYGPGGVEERGLETDDMFFDLVLGLLTAGGMPAAERAMSYADDALSGIRKAARTRTAMRRYPGHSREDLKALEEIIDLRERSIDAATRRQFEYHSKAAEDLADLRHKELLVWNERKAIDDMFDTMPELQQFANKDAWRLLKRQSELDMERDFLNSKISGRSDLPPILSQLPDY